MTEGVTTNTSTEQRIKVGLAEAVITPSVGVPMSGYAARKGVAQGVHDDLHVRSLIVEGERTAIGILSASVIGLSEDVIADVRREVGERTGLAGSNILMAATHTHSGPTLTEDYEPLLKEKCIECTVAAWENRAEGSLGIGKGCVDGVGRNRRHLEYGGLPVDTEIGIIKVEDGGGEVKGVLFNYACHPTTMGPRNLMISEDWPYYAIETIKDGIGHDSVVMFVNGAEGDINPGYSSGLSAVGAYIPIRTWEYTEKIGTRLGKAVLEALPGIGTRDRPPVKSVTGEVELPFRRHLPLTVADAEGEVKKTEEALERLAEQGAEVSQTALDQAKVDVFFARLVLDRAKWFYSDAREESIAVEIQSILLDDAVFTTFPGEVFVEIGLEVKRRSPFSKTFIIGLANAGRTGGYLPTREEFGAGDYEVFGTRYSEDAGDKLIEATLEQIKKLE